MIRRVAVNGLHSQWWRMVVDAADEVAGNGGITAGADANVRQDAMISPN